MLVKARALAEQTGLPIELRARQRMNAYVGSPVWGNERLLKIVPLTAAAETRRHRPSALSVA